MYAGGVRNVDDARRLVDDGIYRLCIDREVFADDLSTEAVAEFSRVLGRCI